MKKNNSGGGNEQFYLPNPNGIKKREKIKRHIWFFVQKYFYATTPKFLGKWRIFCLRAFGAEIGKECFIASSTYVHLPWKLHLGDGVSIDEQCYLQGEIYMGNHVAIGNNVHIVTEGHNVKSRYFEGSNHPVRIGNSCFIGGDVYIARGVNIGTLSVVGAKSVVWHDVEENTIAFGNPCERKGYRIPPEEFSQYTY